MHCFGWGKNGISNHIEKYSYSMELKEIDKKRKTSDKKRDQENQLEKDVPMRWVSLAHAIKTVNPVLEHPSESSPS